MRKWTIAAMAALIAAVATAAYLQYTSLSRLAEVRRQEANAQRRIAELDEVKRLVADPIEHRHLLYRHRADMLHQLDRRAWSLWGDTTAQPSQKRAGAQMRPEPSVERQERARTGSTEVPSGEQISRLARALGDAPGVQTVRIRDGKLSVMLGVASQASALGITKRLAAAGLIDDGVIRQATDEEIPQGGFVLEARLSRKPRTIEAGR